MLSRPGATPARGTPIAFLWTISVALCPSPRTLPIAWCTPPVTSKAWNPIISTLATVLRGCACIVVYAVPTCSSVTMIPNSVLNMSGVASSCPHGTQYNDRLHPTILEPQNHRGPLIDPATGSLAQWRWWVTLGPQIQSSKGVTGTLSCIPKLTWPD